MLAALSISRAFVRCQLTTAKALRDPDLYNGILTKYGWLVVPSTHVVRGWTQPLLNKLLDERFEAGAQVQPLQIQAVADHWIETVDLKTKPKVRKVTLADKMREDDLKLYLQQLKEEPGPKSKIKRLSPPRSLQKRAAATGGEVSFTNAWNYYMAVKYRDYDSSVLLLADIRKELGTSWRLMTTYEKDAFREEYAALLQLGKDIYRGKIVDREVKDRAMERLRRYREGYNQRLQETADKFMEEETGDK